jgi:repressor LexA
MGDVYSNRIRELRKLRGMSQEVLSERMGGDIALGTISKLESGRMALTQAYMMRVASALGVEPYEIIAPLPVRMVPVLGNISAGAFAEALETPQGYIPIPPAIGGPRCFALRPMGDSMNLVASPGDYIVVDPDKSSLENGRLYAIRNGDGEATFKRYRSDPPQLVPASDNPVHKTVSIGAEPFTVIGRVIYIGKEV